MKTKNETTDKATARPSAFKQLEIAVLADTFDGTISKGGRAELVHAFRAFKVEHAALLAVAEAAQKALEYIQQKIGHGESNHDRTCEGCGICDDLKKGLAAVREGKAVASVKYQEAVFHTQADAECWVTQERRSDNSFHVIESIKAAAGWRVVFERRSGKAVAS